MNFMLTIEDIKLLQEEFGKMFDKRDSELLIKIKSMVREEVESEAKETRGEIKLTKLFINSEIINVQHRLKDIEISSTRRDEKLETLDLKIEAFHNKLDKKIDINHQDAMNAFKVLHNTMDQLHSELTGRVDKLEKN